MSIRPSPDPDPAEQPGLLRHRWFVVIAVAGAILDAWTKSLAFAHHRWMHGELGADQPLELWRSDWATLSLVRETNSGMAFGLLQEHANAPAWLATARALAVTVLLFLAWRTPRGARLQHFGLGLLCGGTVGNLSDNLLQPDHAVRDFLLATAFDWTLPACNTADVLIVLGGAALAWLPIRHHRRRRGAAPNTHTRE
ncbi:MAG: signal peptidase II [Planctomycetes bacterium]|nr:signal peptidase II [Planctomycetota bacterium]MCB9871826.1 signal peptidase II [Planctomycetota bacterium]